ncbi:FtsQ-type POTRA domain-containing protein [Jiangella aurantiaca]|uniref:FtsQ-type POTRA domain-containing protein n=1 Tax=Jiangella aurantiaca TaxID=2530373 RepID=A0A4R5AEB3_9ACTN|nr:FtsQ-type POTRA domain-containing protein [Jiangella aurantiaca]TDD69630.1 FtsQ-type POTRA domain-containing protein [Jiangella aurantiaca]
MSLASRSPSAQLFAARARRQRLRRLLGLLLALLGVAVVSGLVWLVGWSSVLSVKSVSVEGVPSPLTDEVLSLAEAPMDTPLARVDTGAVADRVSELPEAASVDVRRSWPSTLTIDVTPRVPVAAVSADGSWWSVDETGALFGAADSRPDDLPVLTAPGDDSSSDVDDAVRAAGVTVLTGLPTSLYDLVDTVEAHSEADIRLELTDGAVVRWGTADDIDRKAEVLLALIGAQEEAPSSYDVSAPEHPAVNP